MELIFETRNTSITKAKWHKGPKGGLNPVGEGGICSAMSAIWIARSRARGIPITDRVGLGSQHRIAITQGAYDVHTGVGDRWLLASQNLPMGKMLVGKPAPPFLIADHLRRHAGYSNLKISRVGAAHSMASAVIDDEYWFFDPNVGLFRTNSVGFQVGVSEFLAKYYEPLLDTYEIIHIN